MVLILNDGLAYELLKHFNIKKNILTCENLFRVLVSCRKQAISTNKTNHLYSFISIIFLSSHARLIGKGNCQEATLFEN